MPIPACYFMKTDSCSFFEASLDAGVGGAILSGVETRCSATFMVALHTVF